MRLILTSDWQADTHNLDKCEIALKELIDYCQTYNPDAVIHCGDFKHAYNPIDANVYKFWIKAVKKISLQWPFYANLGNHDNLSQSLESENWFDLLRVSGAKTISRQPAWHKIGDGRVAFLPFTKDKKKEQEWADYLGNNSPRNTVLVFHTGLKGASLGGGRVYTEEGVYLHAEKYLACFGGHFHEHQRLENTDVYYVGSPFCQDWGEANQFKGHLLVDISGNNYQITRLPTRGIPHWYDSYFLAKHDLNPIDQTPIPEPGAYIRKKVVVSTRHFSRQLAEAEAKLRTKYGDDKRYYVVPKIVHQEVDGVKLNAASDSEKLTDYIAATLPDDAKFSAKRVHRYMLKKLDRTAQVLPGAEVRFKKVTASNVLVFKDVSVNYENQGIVLVSGKNQDWPDHSNGAGKSSLLSLLTVGLFGQTPKRQRNDAWANERNKQAAWVRVELVDSNGRKIEVFRQRRPHSVVLKINGKDMTSGIRDASKSGTQGDIEKLLGFDYHTLTNSVFFDQTVANSFVFGQHAGRMDLVAKLQNLERFDIALDSVKADEKNIGLNRTELQKLCERLEIDIRVCETKKNALAARVSKNFAELLAAKQEQRVKIANQLGTLSLIKGTQEQLQQDTDDQEAQLTQCQQHQKNVYGLLRSLEDQIKRADSLRAMGKCGVCGQSTVNIRADKAAVEEHAVAQKKYDKLAVQVATLTSKIKQNSEILDEYEMKVANLDYKLNLLLSDIDSLSVAAAQEAKQNAGVTRQRQDLAALISQYQDALDGAKKDLLSTEVTLQMYEYVRKAFSRHGMPMYLSAALCPVLNNAAEEYSEIFTDGKIKIRFDVVDEEFTVTLLNPAGSNKPRGQSVGESALAGVIVAFALRSVAPKTNLLILDEPGHGLDPVAARRFAEGLLTLKARFETILVTTHSPAIAGVLSGEKTWVVTKKKGLSTLSIE